LVPRRLPKNRFSTASGVEEPVHNQYSVCPNFCFFVSGEAGKSLDESPLRGFGSSRLFDIVDLEGIRGRRVLSFGRNLGLVFKALGLLLTAY
jgi:hypothetical protein